MNYQMTVGADKHKVIESSDVLWCKCRNRPDMVNLDQTSAEGAILSLEREATYLAKQISMLGIKERQLRGSKGAVSLSLKVETK